MEKPDLEHLLSLAEGTLKHIDWILTSNHEIKDKITWLKNTMKNYKNHKSQIETKGYISYTLKDDHS